MSVRQESAPRPEVAAEVAKPPVADLLHALLGYLAARLRLQFPDHEFLCAQAASVLAPWPADPAPALAAVNDSLLAAMDQPSIDGFNTFVVSRAARQEGPGAT